MKLYKWRKAVNRYLCEAQDVLKQHGYSIIYDDVVKINPSNRAVEMACRIVAGSYWLDKYVTSGMTDKALDRLHEICDSYEQFCLAKNVDSYGKTVFTTHDVYKHLSAGAKHSIGGKKGRDKRVPKCTEEQGRAAIDLVISNNPKMLIGAVRDLAAEQLNMSSKQLIRVTKKYNPKKM